MPTATIDLPFPPSLNRLWRVGRNRKTGKALIYMSPAYRRWIRVADGVWLTQKRQVRAGCPLPIEGDFSFILLLATNRRRDQDNCIKACLDFLQRIEVISNDRNARKSTLEWVDKSQAPLGARLIITAL